jgi:hypothetical protein
MMSEVESKSTTRKYERAAGRVYRTVELPHLSQKGGLNGPPAAVTVAVLTQAISSSI